jgi:predicted lysophospholipase L1 biosynthesis ABC-type transport system permease subunit
VRLTSLDEPARPTIYYPTRQSPNSLMTLVVKAANDAPPLLPIIRDELRRLDPNIPIERPATLESLLARSFEGRRLPMLFLGPFALSALALAAVGIYGVLALAVRERTREIGIRIALGARASDVRRLVLGRAAQLTGVGLVAGAGAALIATRAMKSLLFGIAPTDPFTFAAVAAGVATVALVASWLPARRATRIDPMETLKAE